MEDMLHQLVAATTASSAGVGAPLPTIHEPNVGPPEGYDGNSVTCNAFLCNCYIISLQPLTLSSKEARVAYTINHLTGRARLWGTAEWQRGTHAFLSFQSFANELRRVFGTGPLGAKAGRKLLDLVQGSRPVTDYAIDFRTEAPMCGWNPATLCDVFMRGLTGYIKDELVAYELPSTLEGLIELATRLNLRILACRRERRSEFQSCSALPHSSSHSRSPVTPASSSFASTAPVSVEDPEPMQLGRTRLSPEERERRQREGRRFCSCRGGHSETIQVLLLSTPSQPVILGYPWLRRHNPNIDWTTCSVREWGETC